MKRILFLFFTLTFFQVAVKAQPTLFQINGSPLDTIFCNDTCMAVTTDHLWVKQTTSYTSQVIPFAPVNMSSGSTVVPLQDDKFSSAIPIGFTFCFYGNSYTQCVISSNGQISFNLNYANGIASFQTMQSLPYFNSTFPDDAIFCPFVDYNILQGGTIRYKTIGTAPFRKFIVEYSGMHYFGGICTMPGTSTIECIMNETYNSIEIHVTNKPICDGDPANWLNYATLGVQSVAASSAYTVPGMNASIWTASNQSWQIEPNGPFAFHVDWYNEVNALIATNLGSLWFCSSNFPRTLHAKLIYDCPHAEFVDTITIVKSLPVIDSTSINKTSCTNVADGGVYVYATASNPPILYNIDFGPYSLSPSFSNVSYGFHNISIQDATGCMVTHTIWVGTISTLNLIPVNVVKPTCPDSNGSICVTPSGGVPPYTLLWNTGDTSQCIYNLTQGNYTCTVTDAQGCKSTAIVFLNFLNVPQAPAVITKAVCNQNGAIDVSPYGGFPPYTYSWSNLMTTQDINGLSSAWYSLTITDSVNCVATYGYFVPDTLQVQDSIDLVTPTTCGLSNGVMVAIAYDGLPPYHYLWNTGDTTATISGMPGGGYICTVTDANNCMHSDGYYLQPSNALSLQLYKANAHCDTANNGQIYTGLLWATSPISYLWSTGDTTSQIDSLYPGNYFVSITDSNGCFISDTVTIGYDGVPHVTVLSYTPPRCFGDTNGWVTLGGIGGAPPYKYSIDSITFQTFAQITGISSGVYTVYIRDANSCVRDSVMYFQGPPELIINHLTADTNICFYDEKASIDIGAIGGTPPYLYFNNMQGWQSDSVFTQLGSGMYIVSVKDTNDCIKDTSIQIIGPPAPFSFVKHVMDIDCYVGNTGTILYTPQGGWGKYSITWKDVSLHTMQRDQLMEGSYPVILTDSMGCTLHDENELTRQNCCEIYFPNVFSPNMDGVNDIFRPISVKDVRDTYFAIYDRWGARVFETDVFRNGWNGRISDEDAVAGVYFYMFRYKCNITDQEVIIKGDVTLIR